MAALTKIDMPVGVAPPDIPSLPGASPALLDYLRRQNTWINQQLQSKIPQQTAVPSVMFLSPSGYIWKLTVSDAGAFIPVRVTPGSNLT